MKESQQVQFEGDSQVKVIHMGDSQVEFVGDSQFVDGRGRPPVYSREIANIICDRVSKGESLKRICEDEEMPCRYTVHKWLLEVDNPEKRYFIDKYAQACDVRAELMFDEIIDISDNTDNVIRKGAEKKSNAYAQAQKLKIESRKWYLSKVMPKKYGNKIDLTSDNKEIKGNVITIIDSTESEGE